jgi:hypothetical protein
MSTSTNKYNWRFPFLVKDLNILIRDSLHMYIILEFQERYILLQIFGPNQVVHHIFLNMGLIYLDEICVSIGQMYSMLFYL